MYVVDLDRKVVHDLSRPQYECNITKISKERRKKIFTKDGIDRFFEDRMNSEYNGCQFCMPDNFTFNMQTIFNSGPQ